jgi:hypothetical protein
VAVEILPVSPAYYPKDTLTDKPGTLLQTKALERNYSLQERDSIFLQPITRIF